MKLNIPERILAMNILAEFKLKKSNFINLKAIQDLESRLIINDEEEKKYGLTVVEDENGSHYKWNSLGFTEQVEIEFSDKQKQILIKQLVEMNERDQLTADHISLCEKLVPNPEEVFTSKEESTESK